MKIATWNVNSLKVRLPHLLDWLKKTEADIVLLQEIKGEASAFPEMELKAAGYHAICVGQKAYNGVAILSRTPIHVTLAALPGDAEDAQARYLEAETGGVTVASLYVPNGNPVESEKYPYKLRWLDRLYARARYLLASEKKVILGGDYNIIPQAEDCHDPALWRDDALFRLEVREKWRRLVNDGWTEAYRALHPEAKAAYSFWDYQNNAFLRDNGIRIDHLLLSPEAANGLKECHIDREPRGLTQPSDHTPVMLTLT